MRSLKSRYVLVIFILLSQIGLSQIPHNSKRFEITDFFYPDLNGNYIRYRAHGFAQQHTDQNKGRLFFLPIIQRNDREVRYIGQDGLEFEPQRGEQKVAKSIIVPLSVSSELPNDFQIPALASEIGTGTSVKAYVRPILKLPNGQPYLIPQAQNLFPAIQNMAQPLLEAERKQKAAVELYRRSYIPEVVSLSEVEISLVIDGHVLANEKHSGTYVSTSGELAAIEIVDPTLYIQNRISQGNLKVFVSYKFRDAFTRTIDAKFDAKKIISRFLAESQQSMVSSSSSGWQILGFGSRRKKLRTSFNSSVQESYKGENHESTSVEMFDASDDMIAEFERDFFPELSREKVIENHLAAAAEAERAGNTTLRDLHTRYASSIQNSDPDLETDIAGAVAHLAANDYAGFIAKGVRWGSHTASGNSSFRRVLNTNAEIESKTRWTQQRTVSVQHSLTENVGSSKTDTHLAWLGLGEAAGYKYPVYIKDAWNRLIDTQYYEGMLVGCVIEGGPAHSAGLLPGMIVVKIGGRTVTTRSQLDDLLKHYEPRDKLDCMIIEYGNNFNYRYRTIPVTLAAGAPVEG
ncbi:MAG: PDZ domain-containing protein [Vulcanimicrobiota bacterium]